MLFLSTKINYQINTYLIFLGNLCFQYKTCNYECIISKFDEIIMLRKLGYFFVNYVISQLACKSRHC